jgi:hypothetical protein
LARGDVQEAQKNPGEVEESGEDEENPGHVQERYNSVCDFLLIVEYAYTTAHASSKKA